MFFIFLIFLLFNLIIFYLIHPTEKKYFKGIKHKFFKEPFRNDLFIIYKWLIHSFSFQQYLLVFWLALAHFVCIMLLLVQLCGYSIQIVLPWQPFSIPVLKILIGQSLINLLFGVYYMAVFFFTQQVLNRTIFNKIYLFENDIKQLILRMSFTQKIFVFIIILTMYFLVFYVIQYQLFFTKLVLFTPLLIFK